jgi:hypothetical protein
MLGHSAVAEMPVSAIEEAAAASSSVPVIMHHRQNQGMS